MGAHVRKQIRDALVKVLEGAAESMPVIAGRMFPMRGIDLPCYVVHVDDEDIETLTMHAPAMLDRTCVVRIDCLAREADELDDQLDRLAANAEHAIAADVALGGLLNQAMTPSGIEVERLREAEVPLARLTLRYVAAYVVYNNAVDMPLSME